MPYLNIEDKQSWYEKNKHKRKYVYDTRARMKKFGLTEKDYDELYNLQNGCCAICGTHQSNLNRRLAIDHCHQSGAIRGLLCGNCNTALGKFRDNTDYLENAIKYLKG